MDSVDRYVGGQYLASNPSWHGEDSPWKAKQIAAMLNRNSLVPQSIVDVGCGAGGVLRELRTRLGPEVELAGFDLSEDAIALCRAQPVENVDFFLGDLFETSSSYVVGMAIDVAEHVEDYFDFLRKLGGQCDYAVVHIPLALSAQTVLRGAPLTNARSDVGHIHTFTREMFAATLSETGHRIVDWCYTSQVLDGDLGGSNRAKVIGLARRSLFRINNEFTVRALGGFSCLYLTELDHS